MDGNSDSGLVVDGIWTACDKVDSGEDLPLAATAGRIACPTPPVAAGKVVAAGALDQPINTAEAHKACLGGG